MILIITAHALLVGGSFLDYNIIIFSRLIPLFVDLNVTPGRLLRRKVRNS